MFIKGNDFLEIRIKNIVYKKEQFEVYKTIQNDNLLIVTASLYNKWIEDKLLFNVDPFKKAIIDNINFYYIKSNKEFELKLIESSGVSMTKQSALNFVFSLKQMRKQTNVSLYDGIYIEEYGYVLPTYTSKNISDDALLGYFFSGNQSKHLSDGQFKSLLLTDNDFDEIAKMMNIEIKKQENTNISEKKERKFEKFNLVGRPELEKFFNEHIINILNDPERYKKLGIDFPSSIILYGPPGCGKTYAVDRLVEFLGLPKFEINSSSVASPYIHDTSKKVYAVFENAINNAPSVVVIDEMESYLSNRNSVGDSSYHIEEVAEFLRQIQEANNNHVLVIAMTNMIDKIDPAILRKGRFDNHIEVGYPSIEEIESLLKFLLSKISIANDINLSEIAKKLEGKSLADVNFVVKEAALISGNANLDKISNDSIQEAINALPKNKERKKIGFGD
jgi:cell division protease FtsH